jgi:flagellar capping protein FliD
MAITQSDLDQLRNEFDAKLARVTVESMNSATAIGAYGERFNAVDARFNAVDAQFAAVDARFSSLEAQMDTRFSDIDRRLDRIDGRSDRLEAKLDNRFGWQTVMFTALGLLTLFGDAIRGAIGL